MAESDTLTTSASPGWQRQINTWRLPYAVRYGDLPWGQNWYVLHSPVMRQDWRDGMLPQEADTQADTQTGMQQLRQAMSDLVDWDAPVETGQQARELYGISGLSSTQSYDYASARALLYFGKRFGSAKRLRRNTWAVAVPRDGHGNGGYIGIRFHHTDIVRFYPDGRIRIQLDGWYTNSTLDRVSMALPANLFALKHERGAVWMRVNLGPVTPATINALSQQMREQDEHILSPEARLQAARRTERQVPQVVAQWTPYVEGVEIDSATCLLRREYLPACLAARRALADNRRLDRLLSRLLKRYPEARVNRLEWEEQVEGRHCTQCALANQDPAHLWAHLEQGWLTHDLLLAANTWMHEKRPLKTPLSGTALERYGVAPVLRDYLRAKLRRGPVTTPHGAAWGNTDLHDQGIWMPGPPAPQFTPEQAPEITLSWPGAGPVQAPVIADPLLPVFDVSHPH